MLTKMEMYGMKVNITPWGTQASFPKRAKNLQLNGKRQVISGIIMIIRAVWRRIPTGMAGTWVMTAHGTERLRP